MHDLDLLDLGHARTREQVAQICFADAGKVGDADDAVIVKNFSKRDARLLSTQLEGHEGVSQGFKFRIESGAATAGRGEGRQRGSSCGRRDRRSRCRS